MYLASTSGEEVGLPVGTSIAKVETTGKLMTQTKQKKTTDFRDWEYVLNSYT